MAFADPQSITISGSANSLPRTGSADNSGTFTKDDANLRLQMKHSYAKRNRSVIRLDHRKVAADPLIAAQNLLYSMSISIIVDRPPVGYSPTEVKAVLDGFLANLAASSGANTIKFLGGES